MALKRYRLELVIVLSLLTSTIAVQQARQTASATAATALRRRKDLFALGEITWKAIGPSSPRMRTQTRIWRDEFPWPCCFASVESKQVVEMFAVVPVAQKRVMGDDCRIYAVIKNVN